MFLNGILIKSFLKRILLKNKKINDHLKENIGCA
jgi:hypothetical protein